MHFDVTCDFICVFVCFPKDDQFAVLYLRSKPKCKTRVHDFALKYFYCLAGYYSQNAILPKTRVRCPILNASTWALRLLILLIVVLWRIQLRIEDGFTYWPASNDCVTDQCNWVTNVIDVI